MAAMQEEAGVSSGAVGEGREVAIDVAKSSASIVSEAESEAAFSSKWAFWLTAVGCSVGFGNVWRFPYYCYEHGGFAFVLAYLIGVIIVSIPVSVLEMAVGQLGRGGPSKAWSKMGRLARAPGLSGWVSYAVCSYYPLLLVWSLLYFVNCFQSELPWRVTQDVVDFCRGTQSEDLCIFFPECSWNQRLGECVENLLRPADVFFREQCFAFTNIADGDHLNGFVGISGWNVLCKFISWTANCLAIVAGARVLGYIMYVTMTLPTIFIIVLCIVGATLEGSGQGLRVYLAQLNISELDTTAWVNAITQSIFSVGLAQGALTSFASHNKRGGNNLIKDSLVICSADTLFALLAGFSVFSVIGHLAFSAGKEIDELPLSGISLAFTTYPVGLTSIPGVGANILTGLFFAALWLLGMDTLVGLTEAVILSIVQSRVARRYGARRWHAAIGISASLFIFPGLLLCTNLGYFFLDILDRYASLSQTFFVLIECGTAGWLYLATYSIKKVGLLAHVVQGITLILGGALFGILSVYTTFVIGVCVGIPLALGGIVVSYFLANKGDENGEYTWKQKLYYMTLYNIEALRSKINEEGCAGNTCWKLPRLFSVFIKYIIPFIVTYLVAAKFLDQLYTAPDPGVVDPYPWYIFAVGQIFPFFLFLVTIVFLFFPDKMIPFLPHDYNEDIPAIGTEFVDSSLNSTRHVAGDTELAGKEVDN